MTRCFYAIILSLLVLAKLNAQDTLFISTLQSTHTFCELRKASLIPTSMNFLPDQILATNHSPSYSNCDVKTSTDSAYWFSVLLHNDTKETSQWFIHGVENDHVTVFAIGAENKIISTAVGGDVAYIMDLQWPLAYYYNSIELEPNTTTRILIRLVSMSRHPPQLNVRLENEIIYHKTVNAYFQDRLTAMLFVTFFLGALAFACLFMLFLFFKNKQNVYLYYSLFLLGNIIYGSTKMPVLTKIGFWIDYFPIVRYILNEPVQFLSFAAYNLFAIELLNIRDHDKKLGRVIEVISWIYVTYAGIHILNEIAGPDIAVRDFSFVAIRALFFPLNLVILIWIMLKIKSPVTHYFLSGASIFIIGSLLASYFSLDFEAFEKFNTGLKVIHIYQLGVLGEAFCFSFALGYRIKLTEDERHENQQAFIDQLQKNKEITDRANIELEAKVRERSEEIINITREIERERAALVRADLEKKLAEMEMMALRSQMNPHFLFNSLNSIKYFILSNQNSKASGYLSRFSKLIRQILEHSQHNLIPLDAELAALQLYIEIEANRFDDKFEFSINVDEHIQSDVIHIPPMLLQPFVENAIWHGLLHSPRPHKQLTIRIREDEHNGEYLFIVEDNGVGRKRSQEIKNSSVKRHQSVGIGLTENRIRLFNSHSGKDIRLEIEDLYNGEESAGTRVIIRLNVNYQQT